MFCGEKETGELNKVFQLIILKYTDLAPQKPPKKKIISLDQIMKQVSYTVKKYAGLFYPCSVCSNLLTRNPLKCNICETYV